MYWFPTSPAKSTLSYGHKKGVWPNLSQHNIEFSCAAESDLQEPQQRHLYEKKDHLRRQLQRFVMFSLVLSFFLSPLKQHNGEALHVTGRLQCRFNLHRLRLFNTSLFHLPAQRNVDTLFTEFAKPNPMVMLVHSGNFRGSIKWVGSS
jgi:hypothetical protein